MKKLICVLILSTTLPAALWAGETGQEVTRAKQAIALFAQSLKSELVSAMQAGGPVNAIEVCHSRAEVIARQISQQSGMQLSRVSTFNRNPDNAARDWQIAVLETFEERRSAGEKANTLSWTETAETSGGPEFRFMKAIPTDGLCLQCHGTAIPAEVAGKLAELYPHDKAVGYREGDIRGAFVVTSLLD